MKKSREDQNHPLLSGFSEEPLVELQKFGTDHLRVRPHIPFGMPHCILLTVGHGSAPGLIYSPTEDAVERPRAESERPTTANLEPCGSLLGLMRFKSSGGAVMRRGPDTVKLELWRRRMREFERGTETVAAFCGRVGVSAASFYLWRRRVAGQADETSGPKSPGRGDPQSGQVTVPPLSFLPVQITGQAPSVIEVLLTCGTRVLVPSGDRESLRAVLEVVAGNGEEQTC